MLRITTECTTCYHWLPPLLTTYRRRFPAVEVRIDVEATSRPVQRLLDGVIDLALMSTPVRDRRLASRPVFTDQVVVIVSPQHRLAGGGASRSPICATRRSLSIRRGRRACFCRTC